MALGLARSCRLPRSLARLVLFCCCCYALWLFINIFVFIATAPANGETTKVVAIVYVTKVEEDQQLRQLESQLMLINVAVDVACHFTS